MGSRARLRKKIDKETRHKQFVRNQLINKYGCKCAICGKELTGGEVTLDHIKPISRGGQTIFENCQILCFNCNLNKGDKYNG
jgi:5-methylcytosine-specific restriction endonuclease McrA